MDSRSPVTVPNLKEKSLQGSYLDDSKRLLKHEVSQGPQCLGVNHEYKSMENLSLSSRQTSLRLKSHKFQSGSPRCWSHTLLGCPRARTPAVCLHQAPSSPVKQDWVIWKLVVAYEHSRVLAIFCSKVFTSDHPLYNVHIVYSQYMGGLKWKPWYKKSRVLASARVPPIVLLFLVSTRLLEFILLLS